MKTGDEVWFHQSTEKIIKRIMFVKAGPVRAPDWC